MRRVRDSKGEGRGGFFLRQGREFVFVWWPGGD